MNEGPTRLYLSAKDGKCFNEYREQCGDNCGLGSRLRTIASSCEHYREFWMGVDSYRVVGTCNQVNPCADNVTTFRDISFLPVEQSLEPGTPFHPISLPTFLTPSPRNTMQYEGSFVRSLPASSLFFISWRRGEKKREERRETKRNRQRPLFCWKLYFLLLEKNELILSQYTRSTMVYRERERQEEVEFISRWILMHIYFTRIIFFRV